MTTSNLPDPGHLLAFATGHWRRVEGLIAGELLAIIVALAVAGGLKLPAGHGALVLLALLLGAFLAWMHARRIPRTRRGKLGFMVCLAVEGEDEQRKIRSDFVEEMRVPLGSGRTGQAFDFLVMPDHVASRAYDQEKAARLLRKCGARFGVFGRVKRREINNSWQHIIDLLGIVGHQPLPSQTQRQFALEFSTLLPTRLRVSEKNDTVLLGVTSQWTACTAKYVIGMAAAFSGDLTTAEQLWLDARAASMQVKAIAPGLLVLRAAVPIRLGQLYLMKAQSVYNEWRRHRTPELLSQTSALLAKVPPEASVLYGVRILRSILLFLGGRDLTAAKRELAKCSKERDGTWLVGLGFLYAYQGRLDRAVKCYKNALKRQVGHAPFLEAEEFMVWVLTEEPDKYQLHFMLGALNWMLKKDRKAAVSHLRKFVESGQQSEFSEQRKLASQWVTQGNA